MTSFVHTGFIWMTESAISSRAQWKLIGQSASSMFMPTRRNAFTGLLLHSFLEQVLLLARFWNLYGPDYIQSQLRLRQHRLPIMPKLLMIIPTQIIKKLSVLVSSTLSFYL